MPAATRQVTIQTKKSTKQFNIHTLEDWNDVAEYLIKLMKPGNVITLSGDLGAGKTTLVQYIAKQLGVAKRALSPTFALIRYYIVRRPRSDVRRLVHVDAYRIEDERDLLALDLDEELAEPGTVMIIEWPEQIPKWVKKHQAQKIAVKIKMK